MRAITGIAVWLRIEIPRRGRSLGMLALLIAMATATVLTALAGARRGASAVDRLLADTRPATAVVSPQQEGFDWSRIRRLPEVADLATFPAYTGFGIEQAPAETVALYLPADADALHGIEHPVVLHGRLADPTSAEEAVVTAAFVHTYGYGVGDTVTMRLFTPKQVDTGVSGVRSASPARPAGPRVPVRIVGVVRSLWFSDGAGDPGRLIPSAGLITHYRANLLGAHGDGALSALVRLHGGLGDLPRFRADLARVTGRPDIDVADRQIAAQHARDLTGFEAACLLAFGLAALTAALVLVGASIARYCSAAVFDLHVLRALGLTPAQGIVWAAAGPMLAAVVGTNAGIAGAVIASRWLPFGAAARLEPAPGFDVDWLVLGSGWVFIPLLVLAGSVLAAWVSAARVTARGRPERRSVVARAAVSAGLPTPVVVGLRFALEPTRGPNAVPVRAGLVGAITGVLGVVAAFTFSAGVADAAGHPERFGQTHQATVSLGYNGKYQTAVRPVLTAVAADPAVANVVEARYQVADAGASSAVLFTVDKPDGLVVSTAGRLPAARNEAMLAPTTAHELGLHIGSVASFTGDAGSTAFRVVGIGFVPQTEYNDYDSGAWITAAGYDRLFGGFLNSEAYVTLRPGADAATVVPRLSRAAEAAGGGPYLFANLAFMPQRLAEIHAVRILPVVLGGFLALLAMGAVGHTVAMGVRRRRRDLAILRALGMTRRQARGVVLTQATVLAVIGLLFGIPLGLAIGRTLWRVMAATTPLHYVMPVAFWTLVLAAPVTVILAILLAVAPGLAAARMRVGQVLRAE